MFHIITFEAFILFEEHKIFKLIIFPLPFQPEAYILYFMED